MYGAYCMTTPRRTPKPHWAVAFKKRRETEVGSQEELAMRADVSQSLISQIERGVQHPTGVSVERFARLLRALNWTAPAFSEATGISLGPTIEESLPSRRAEVVTPHARRLPQGLQAAVDTYGKRFDDLRDPKWQQYLAGFSWREGEPEDPEAWVDLYRDLTRAGVVPGEN